MEVSRQFIETYWPLTEVSVGGTQQRLGDRLVSIIECQEGQFFLKITDQWRSNNIAARHTFIFDFFRKKNFDHAPEILKTKTGQNFQNINGYYAYILTFLPGREPAPTADFYRRIGTIIGRLHMLSDYPYPYLFSVNDVLPEFFELAENLPFGEEYIQLVNMLPNFDHFPKSLIHGEVIGNAIQTQDGNLVILDWDEAGLGPRILDLGHPLIQVFVSENLDFDQEGAHAFYQGYLANIKLSQEELDFIFEAGLFYALRYIIYGDTDRRWQRIKFALENRALLTSVIKRAELYSAP